MRVTDEIFYDGAKERIRRLNLHAYAECRSALEGLDVRLREERDTNGGMALRKLIDDRFRELEGWEIAKSGDIDWRKPTAHGPCHAALGVEIQVSARSDLVVRDVIHVRNALEDGSIDVGVIVVPSDRLAVYLTDRCPNVREARRAIEEDMRAQHLSLVLIGIEHDGPSEEPLTKQSRIR